MASVCIIIPAFNEEDSIERVIKAVKKVSRRYQIVVINDGSTDATATKALAQKVTVINLPFNLGIGGAVQTGLKYALRHGYQTAVQVDADGQHLPSEVPKLLKALSKNTAMVIGSRYVLKTKYQSPPIRRIAISCMSLLIYWVCGQRIYDPTSGFRAYSLTAMKFLTRNYPSDFPEPESIVSLLKHGFTLKEIGVEMKARTTGTSSLQSLKGVYLSISIIVSIIISALRRPKVYGS